MPENCQCDYKNVLSRSERLFADTKNADVITGSASFVDIESGYFSFKLRMKERTKNGKEVPRVTTILAPYCPFCGKKKDGK
ncbi:hypothetical protein [Wohlfahrtiimonas chitiniclastica]|uniref:hypothetical protein n=1 Tax=Wohlfahrtiimonas chitiniclastica TaxID=400946 RepID=UPI001BCB4BED|nr:hypothetical protein [Wohlfahrtiimonas chitiniclastica]MBS7837354.1 hypothetical protein [Wohlfahrtiimonas chitiniclastica]